MKMTEQCFVYNEVLCQPSNNKNDEQMIGKSRKWSKLQLS